MATQTPTPPMTPTPADPRRGGGLAITGFVLGIVALVLCWVPIVNNLAAVLGVLGVVFGFWGWRRARRGKARHGGLGVAGTIIAAIAVVLVFATQSLYSSAIDEVDAAVKDAADGNVAQTKDDRAAADEALELGETATVGDYEVTVDKVQLNADRAVANANEFNEPAKGQYVMATVTVTYDGDETGTPWVDLTTTLAGSDARMYDTSTADAVVPNDLMDEPDLRPGGTTTGNVAFDVPPKALDDPTISIEDTTSFEETSVFWSVD